MPGTQASRADRPKTGSGLTILVGPNNGGKSTVTEALDAVFRSRPVSFSEGKRNQAAGDKVSLRLEFTSGGTSELCTIASGLAGATTRRRDGNPPPNTCFYLPSRRMFNPYFGEGRDTRESYAVNQASALQGDPQRSLE